jgi:hypothetical protein
MINATAKRKGKSEKLKANSLLRPKDIQSFVEQLVENDFHAKQVLSISHAVSGVIHGATLGIHAIGQGMAQARGLNPKHAIKQVDRLLSNDKLIIDDFFAQWIPYILGQREEVVVALDWTEFDADDHSTIALYLITSHGRATPLVWKTVTKSTIEGWRNEHEDNLLELFAKLRPVKVKRATVLADRGFGDQKLYSYLASLGLDYIIRFRGLVQVESAQGESRPAAKWLSPNGRAVTLRDVKVTAKRTAIAAVVCVHASGMKEAWFLATSRADLKGPEVIKLYGKRFSIEETFRDTKDARFGMGLKATHIGDPARRDRLLLIAAISQALLCLLGAAAEKVGFDAMLRANTVKRRTHSLFTQGCYWYGAIPNLRDEWLESLMTAFGELICQQSVFTKTFGIL